ncbi:hypothetical protein M3223_04780 [Paenibacillus pasadenensis]|uniref:hypothetical protein n=1 Tax=Paenibacillus pasadenensis TaxID=217090 RepID=UPI00203F3F76|nr:hypothetical protein [Paenibacillus pasadenensis]MCM3746665.1 hypothetical protein [Paenibacillus pasadenensis]
MNTELILTLFILLVIVTKLQYCRNESPEIGITGTQGFDIVNETSRFTLRYLYRTGDAYDPTPGPYFSILPGGRSHYELRTNLPYTTSATIFYSLYISGITYGNFVVKLEFGFWGAFISTVSDLPLTIRKVYYGGPTLYISD